MLIQANRDCLGQLSATLFFIRKIRTSMALSEELKWAIVNDFKATNNTTATARNLKVNKKTVALWVKRYQESRAVVKKRSTGRPTILSEAAAKEAVKLLLDGQYSGTHQVGRVLQSKGLVSKAPHRTTVARAAKKVAKLEGIPIRAVRGLPAKEINAPTKGKRMNFASSNLKRRWDRVMFTDRSKFHFSYPGVIVKPIKWVQKGQKPVALKVNHAQVVNLYAGITKWGVTKCHIVAGTSKHKSTYLNKKGQGSKNITSSEYRDVLKQTLLPEGTRIFGGQGVGTWYLQQDNDPTHKVAAQEVKMWNDKKGASVQLLPFWPPSSPDLSPIENFWGWVKAKINEKGCKDFDEYQRELMAVIKKVPKRILSAYFASMKSRLTQTMQVGGGKTSY
jgi:transposase